MSSELFEQLKETELENIDLLNKYNLLLRAYKKSLVKIVELQAQNDKYQQTLDLYVEKMQPVDI